METLANSWQRLKARAAGANNPADAAETIADVASVMGSLNVKNVTTLGQMFSDEFYKKPEDDRTYLMERIIQLAADLPTVSYSSQSLTHNFLAQLWSDLQHPPMSYLGDDYCYRQADGSKNNFLWPHIGASNQPYARTVKPIRSRPAARPDPGVIFDSILKRREFQPHPNGISSVLFYVASIIIHDIFHTSHKDFNISETSSYLDLAPLYGSNLKAQRQVRALKDGMLKPDCFSDERILGFPPGVGTLLIMFNRFHNHVARNLAQIDENHRFSRILHPPGRDPPENARDKYDEALFQTARLITTGLYINIVLKDYVRTILSLNRTNSDWNLDPRSTQGKAMFGSKIPEASGNQVSAEFNLIYRWHSTVSERDEKWTEAAYQRIFPTGKTNPTMGEFLHALQVWAKKLPVDPQHRPFDNLVRDDSGRFADDDLASIWTDSVSDVAGAFGANHVPAVLREVEILGIIQARTWNLASLNEFRKYFNLQPWTSFDDMTSDKYVAEQLRNLYEHPDNVEIYPGIIIEDAKKPMNPGSGLCTNFTISRAILSDAVALVRGDRFYTVDYTTANLTNYGYALADYDTNIDHGCVFYKLVLCAFPNNYSKNSIYAHYPLVIPTENHNILSKLGRVALYDFDHPTSFPSYTTVNSYEDCRAVIQSGSMAKMWPMLHLPVEMRYKNDRAQINAQALATLRQYLMTKPEPAYIRQYCERITLSLIDEYQCRVAGVPQIDVIRDVANLAQVHFAACVFGLPLRSEDNPKGAYTAQDLWAALTAIYSSLHTRENPADLFKAQQIAAPAVHQLGKLIEQNIDSVDPKNYGVLSGIIDMLQQKRSSDLTDQSTHLIQTMLDAGVTAQQLVYAYILPITATVVVVQARAFADCIDYFLGPGQSHLEDIHRLSLLTNREADRKLECYVLEAIRLQSNSKTYTTVAAGIGLPMETRKANVSAEQLYQCDLTSANRDEKVFEHPDKFDSTRDVKSYLPNLPAFPPAFPGGSLGRPAVIGVLKAVARLPGLRRAPGPIGQMKTMQDRSGSNVFLNADESAAYTYPGSLKVNFGPEDGK